MTPIRDFDAKADDAYETYVGSLSTALRDKFDRLMWNSLFPDDKMDVDDLHARRQRDGIDPNANLSREESRAWWAKEYKKKAESKRK